MEFEDEGLYDGLLDEIDEDADPVGFAIARGEQSANDAMVEEWGEDY